MPQNKQAYVRMRVIDDCLRSKIRKYWSKTDLIEKISNTKDIKISERTLDYDIYLMRNCSQLNYNAPIGYSKKENGYFYSDSNFSIANLPLNEIEFNALATAAATLNQFKHISVFREFASTVDKVINLVQHIEYQRSETGLKFMDFEEAPYSVGNEHLDILIDATRHKYPVRLIYKKFDAARPKPRTVSPYLLKEYRNRWYLVGLQHETGSLRKFALDRICSLEPTRDTVFMDNYGFNPQLHFKNAIGISLEEETVEDVTLSFTPHDGNYIKTQYLHSSQEILIDDKTELRVRLKVVINYELISTILSFGMAVKVIEPAVLKQKVIDNLKSCLQLY
ncbi:MULTISPECIES: helix-turn-helix transcriptional regulator [Pontibacter]|uniref:WYL domain-containing protein n=2 Tax=Pontibacter TaxID=323449 RepID=A0ABQ1W922_9BACT|nr:MULTISPECIES: WYL domain-containing protein [Pontibacter]MBF8961742.1 WYL domain-containing protein [Pontibacter sp. FD36]PVY43654.1 putative DNA-binding transcriptional regulator YafY [Pontibacter virosus]GGG18861.1 WYL domain-containing protein [Pontibacter amylolyticus]